ncbi:hypothetical protein GGR19_002502 [Croceicoccus naphthovorans]|jgi:hypothetical protein|nr:hypothetical protein [Croceicoccus naphthovorans]
MRVGSTSTGGSGLSERNFCCEAVCSLQARATSPVKALKAEPDCGPTDRSIGAIVCKETTSRTASVTPRQIVCNLFNPIGMVLLR